VLAAGPPGTGPGWLGDGRIDLGQHQCHSTGHQPDPQRGHRHGQQLPGGGHAGWRYPLHLHRDLQLAAARPGAHPRCRARG